jgi:hypothetical protein
MMHWLYLHVPSFEEVPWDVIVSTGMQLPPVGAQQFAHPIRTFQAELFGIIRKDREGDETSKIRHLSCISTPTHTHTHTHALMHMQCGRRETVGVRCMSCLPGSLHKTGTRCKQNNARCLFGRDAQAVARRHSTRAMRGRASHRSRLAFCHLTKMEGLPGMTTTWCVHVFGCTIFCYAFYSLVKSVPFTGMFCEKDTCSTA